MTKEQLEGLLYQYRMAIDRMQGHIYFIQDEDGVLRRWYPPRRPILDNEE